MLLFIVVVYVDLSSSFDYRIILDKYHENGIMKTTDFGITPNKKQDQTLVFTRDIIQTVL